MRSEMLKTVLTYLLSAVIISLCGGAMAYLAEYAVKEPLLTMERQGLELMISSAGEEWPLDLTVLDQTAEILQTYWLFIPPKLRLIAQGLTWLFQRVSLQ